jgi:hypothetical protein
LYPPVFVSARSEPPKTPQTSASIARYKLTSHPPAPHQLDFTFVCPTEIIAFNDAAPRFEALGCQVVAASTDTAESHLAWQRVSRDQGGLAFMVRRAFLR